MGERPTKPAQKQAKQKQTKTTNLNRKKKEAIAAMQVSGR